MCDVADEHQIVVRLSRDSKPALYVASVDVDAVSGGYRTALTNRIDEAFSFPCAHAAQEIGAALADFAAREEATGSVEIVHRDGANEEVVSGFSIRYA